MGVYVRRPYNNIFQAHYRHPHGWDIFLFQFKPLPWLITHTQSRIDMLSKFVSVISGQGSDVVTSWGDELRLCCHTADLFLSPHKSHVTTVKHAELFSTAITKGSLSNHPICQPIDTSPHKRYTRKPHTHPSHTHTHTHVHMRTHKHTQTKTHTNICTHSSTQIYEHTHTQHTHAYMFIDTCTSTHIHRLTTAFCFRRFQKGCNVIWIISRKKCFNFS